MSISIKQTKKMFGGTQLFAEHDSELCGGTMTFAVYLPPKASSPPPVLYWLSGLTCTEENFTLKAGAQRVAAECGVALVMPDTSPRGAGYPGEDDSYDFGTGAGFYVDATEAPWSARYRMYSYVTKELPNLIESEFDVGARRSIFGHSMGGHGALVVGLRAPERWASISAFSPICAPSEVPWGTKAFGGYLGDNRESWAAYDASLLVKTQQHPHPILIDQGTADEFLSEQLKPEVFKKACAAAGQSVTINMRLGYDHSYFFIATFVEDHVRFHAAALHPST